MAIAPLFRKSVDDIEEEIVGDNRDELFWLDVQRRTDLWEAMNSPRECERIERARLISRVA